MSNNDHNNNKNENSIHNKYNDSNIQSLLSSNKGKHY